VPAIAEVDQGPYVHHGSSAHRFEAHIQEILEVYTDTAYLDTVSQALIPGLPALVTKVNRLDLTVLSFSMYTCC